MLSKSQIRFVSSLKQKKFRKLHGAFVVEGAKSVQEFLQSDYQVLTVFSVPGTHAKVGKIPENTELIEITMQELGKITNLSTPQEVLAVVQIPGQEREEALSRPDFLGRFTLVLDDVQDPGNLGTIIRTADWFGFERIICSVGTVDAYNPKTVQASMGSLARLRVSYMDLSAVFENLQLPVFGAVLNGESIYQVDFGQEGLILLGNEGRGISDAYYKYIRQAVTIPQVGKAESLNVAISAALFCSEVIRRK